MRKLSLGRLGLGWSSDPAFARDRATHGRVVDTAINDLLRGAPTLGAAVRHWLSAGSYPDGQFAHFLETEWASPVLEYGCWLIEDRTEVLEDAPLRRHLLTVAMGAEIITRMGRALLAAEPALPRGVALVLPWCTAWMAQQARVAEGNGQHFLPAFHQQLAAWMGAEATYRERHWGQLFPFDAADERLVVDRAALSRLGPLLVAGACGLDAIVPQLLSLVDGLNQGLALLEDLHGIKADLGRRHYSRPIVHTLQVAGMPLHEPVPMATLLGAAVLTGAISRLAEASASQMAAVANDAAELALPRFQQAAEWIAAELGQVGQTFSLARLKRGMAGAAPAASSAAPGQAFVVDGRPPVPLAIEMAAAYMLDDPTFRESWEVYRWGFLNRPVQTSRRYPVGVILENLAHAGWGRPDWVDDLLEDFAASGFHYFDEESSLPPDTDSIALMFRLTACSSDPTRYRHMLDTPIGWVRANQRANGEVPIWLLNGPGFAVDRDYFAVILQLPCTAIQANLIGGLAAMGVPVSDPLLQGACRWVDREVERWGAASSWFYPPVYWGWACTQWVSPLAEIREASSTTPWLGRLVNERRLLMQGGGLTPLTAALRLLQPGRAGDDPPGLRDALVTHLLERQRSDGSWEAEPLYFGPALGGGMTTHSSRLLTTSYCLRALSRHVAEDRHDGA